ncbi:MAG: DUF4836 family protein [Duncaniella sp.]|nr:DUF4836 family protein [Duncaniella sp.]
MKLNYIFSLAVAAIALLGMTGCSHEAELTDTIPANVAAVVRIDVTELFERAGFEKKGSEVVAPDYWKDAPSEILEVFSNVSDGVDLDNVIVVQTAAGRQVITFEVKDEKALTEVLEKNDKSVTKEDGYNAVSTHQFSMIFNDKQGWAMENRDVKGIISTVKAMEDDAKKQSIAKLAGIKQFLEKDYTINIAGNTAAMGGNSIPAELQEVWGTIGINVEEKEITFEGHALKADGDVVEVNELQAINPAVLSYIPGATNFVALAGCTPEINWDGIIEAISTLGGVQARGVMGILSPYIKSIDGTVMIAAGASPDSSFDDYDSWQFITMIHMPQAKVNEALSTARDMMSRYGIPFSEDKDGVMSARMTPDISLYAGNVDGYLAVANRPFSPNRQNGLAKNFVNKNGGLYFDIQSLRLLNPSAPAWGINIVAEVNTDNVKGAVKLNGTNDDILPTIIKAVM